MNVLIADSSAGILARLSDIITFKTSNAIIYTAKNYDNALQLFTESKPSTVLLGMNLPGDQSMELLRAIKKTGYNTSIIILSIYMNNTMIEECKQLGATIFLDKFLEFEKIPEHINAIEAKIKEPLVMVPMKNQ